MTTPKPVIGQGELREDAVGDAWLLAGGIISGPNRMFFSAFAFGLGVTLAQLRGPTTVDGRRVVIASLWLALLMVLAALESPTGLFTAILSGLAGVMAFRPSGVAMAGRKRLARRIALRVAIALVVGQCVMLAPWAITLWIHDDWCEVIDKWNFVACLGVVLGLVAGLALTVVELIMPPAVAQG